MDKVEAAHKLYREWSKADDDFSANLSRQFGAKATDYRYRLDLRSEWDEQTTEASKLFDALADAFLNASREARAA
jgi:hypothetical protein